MKFNELVKFKLPSYRNQSIGFPCRSIDWFLYDGNFGVNLPFLHSRHVDCLLYKSDKVFFLINLWPMLPLCTLLKTRGSQGGVNRERWFSSGYIMAPLSKNGLMKPFCMNCKITHSYMCCIIDFRSSRPEEFCKKGAHRNFAKFTGKDLCRSLFVNKVAGLRPAQEFSCEF